MNHWRSIIALAVLSAAAASPALAEAPEAKPKPVSFVRDVRPILTRNCFACHGPDEAQRKAKLRLDTREGAFAARENGAAVVPGSLEASELYQRITIDDPTLRMPPVKSGKALPKEQSDIIKRWIEQGAKWESHWAFETPVRPPLPAVKDASWAKNPIDRFILARLEAEGLRPSPEADRYALVRRVSLDLTGLPPSPALVEWFVQNPAPDAYDQLVDRLLKSPAYGERWARPWLDLARYADTKGYEKDLSRSIWRFRDWVIDALNNDMPYDQFTTEQLAGDLLPNATPSQVLATAFHRTTLVNDEGGTDDEEFRVAAVKDRVDTTGQVWLGLTIGCAKCHSHKYDPISQREYYQFFALFDQTEDNDQGDDRPTASFPTRSQQAQIADARARIAQLERDLAHPGKETREAFHRWEKSLAHQKKWTVVRPEQMEAMSRSTMKRLADDSILVDGAGPAKEAYTLTTPLAVAKLTAVRVEAIPDAAMPKKGAGRSPGDGTFVLTGVTVSVRTTDGKTHDLALARAEADFAQDGYPASHALKSPDPKKHGWAVAPRQGEPHQILFRLSEPAKLADGDKLIVRLDHQFEFAYPGFSIGRLRLSITEDADPTLEPAMPAAIEAIVKIAREKRTEAQNKELLRHFADSAADTRPARDEIARLRGAIASIENATGTPVMKELPAGKRRVTKLHRRGNFLDPGEAVEPAVLSSFHTLPKGAPANRLGLARWLAAPNNPLTARVAVNRHWSQFFGRGLVETQEDFGAQGQPPSHPELLDWLAVEFRESGWSLKQLCRLIVTSATYRQTARADSALIERDRFNRLLARGPRFRMEAEMIRDSTLTVSGLLSPKMYGPSVMPYQPDGIWKSTYNTDTWKTSPGADRHRRGLYTFIKRTSPYPAMATMDAPSREICTVRRINTNTPLQALVTLNDRVYVEAAQALARRAVHEGGDSAAARIAFALRAALIRPARDREVAALERLYQQRLDAYRRDPGAAKQLATDPLGPLPVGWSPPELAALTAVCNVILNLDEFLTRG
jgi:hypothetical protein